MRVCRLTAAVPRNGGGRELSVAAAAQQDDRDDDQPDPAVVKQTAEAVGVHIHKSSELN